MLALIIIGIFWGAAGLIMTTAFLTDPTTDTDVKDFLLIPVYIVFFPLFFLAVSFFVGLAYGMKFADRLINNK